MPLNGLKLNDSKTEFLSFHSRQRPQPPIPTIQIGDDKITTSTTARTLGVIFDNTLSLKPHIVSVTKAAFFQLCCISHIHQFLTPEATKTLVRSLISSRLDYCNSALAGLPVVDLQRLQCVQDDTIQLTTTSKKTDYIMLHLMDLHWLPIHSRIVYKIMVLTYRALNGEAPDYIKFLLISYVPSHMLRSSDKLSLVAPHYITKTCGA